MPIIAKASGENYVLCPSGTHVAVCVDIVDLGIIETDYNGEKKKQHKIRVIWQVEDLQDNGKPFTASKRYTNSLHEKAALRKDLESWRGQPFTARELEGFDLENLLSIPAMLNIIHASKDGKVYDNVASIMRLPKNMAAPAPRDYIRVCHRQKQSEPVPQMDSETFAPSDDDVPF